jgi:hypothetical protein
VNVETWVPRIEDIDLRVDTEMEDVQGGSTSHSDELMLPGMDSVISGGGRVDAASFPIWPAMQQLSQRTVHEVLDMARDAHSVGGCILFGMTGQSSTPSLECVALDATRVHLLLLRMNGRFD